MAENENKGPAGEQQGGPPAGGQPPPRQQQPPQQRRERPIAPFTIEFGDDRNRTITVDTLKKRVRGRYSTVRRDAGAVMNKMPDIPGLRMTVDFANRKAVIFDPLEKDAELLQKINSVAGEATAIRRGGGDLTFVKSTEIRLHVDEAKTLVIECCQIVQDKRGVLVDGTSLPDAATIDALPGRKLFDPWNSGRKPRYEDQAEAYYDRLERETV